MTAVGEAGWAIRVPASSANLGAGFDVLGVAVGIHADVGCGEAPEGALAADERHPATVAFRRMGGSGPVWVRSSIPMGRGLGFSGSVRVGGAAAAVVQRKGRSALDDPAERAEILAVTAALEGHFDNVAASVTGGVVACAGATVARVPLALDPAMVVWVPPATTTSTDRSRAALGDTITRADAVFNLGRVAVFVAACATGDPGLLATGVEDRWHQDVRLARVPDSAAALGAARAAGAWAAWLSGSGPTVAMWCDHADVDRIAAALPDAGHVKVVSIDPDGAIIIDR